jgi:hypothetical protein
MAGVHICSFGSLHEVLDGRRHRGQHPDNRRLALAYLKEQGRFSVFEATANHKTAVTVTNLIEDGLIKTTRQDFPWTGAELTAAGEAVLGEKS